MSKIDTNFVKQLYSQAGVELTPEKLNHISNNYTSNEELESAFNLKYNNSQEPKTDPKKKKTKLDYHFNKNSFGFSYTTTRKKTYIGWRKTYSNWGFGIFCWKR